MSDLEARVIRLEQLLAQILRDIQKLEAESGQANAALGLLRNATG